MIPQGAGPNLRGKTSVAQWFVCFLFNTLRSLSSLVSTYYLGFLGFPWFSLVVLGFPKFSKNIKKNIPKFPKMSPKCSQKFPKSSPKVPKMFQKCPQNVPKMSQKYPKKSKKKSKNFQKNPKTSVAQWFVCFLFNTLRSLSSPRKS